MTPSEIATRLSDRAIDVCHHLLPGGKRDGSEWRSGSTAGDKGKSLGVCLKGDKVGVWCDFTTGETGGDLLDLWCAVRSCNMRAAMDEAMSYLGVSEPSVSAAAPAKSYVRPERPACSTPKDQSPVMAYLTGRGLKETTISAFKIGEQGRKIVFPYLRDGALVAYKTLGLDRPNGKKQIMFSPGAEPCLFGWQAIPNDAREVTLVEGEIDAMTAWQYGRPALSVPFGGGSGAKQQWIEHEYRNLERFDTVYLCLDNDEAGNQARDEIIKRLGRERCRLVDIGCKDFNTALDQLFYSRDDVDERYENAKNLDPDKLLGVLDMRDDVCAEFFEKNPTVAGMALPWSKCADTIKFRDSEVTVWTGWSGHGKSQLLNYIAFHGMRRSQDFDKFCIASMEMPAKRTLQRMVRQAAGIAYPTRGYINAILDSLGGKLWVYNQMGSANVKVMLEAFRYAAKRYGVTQFIVDSLAKLGMAEDDYNGQKAAMEALVDFAHEMGVHVHLVAHPRKSDDESKAPGKLDVRGGAILTDLADNVITVWRNKRKEEEVRKGDAGDYANQSDVHMIISKQRLTGVEDKIPLWFDPASAQYMERESHRPRQWVSYSGPIEQSANIPEASNA